MEKTELLTLPNGKKGNVFSFYVYFDSKVKLSVKAFTWIFDYILENEGEEWVVTEKFMQGFEEMRKRKFNRDILPTAEQELECWSDSQDGFVVFRRLSKQADF